MIHIWPFFAAILPEGQQTIERMGKCACAQAASSAGRRSLWPYRRLAAIVETRPDFHKTRDRPARTLMEGHVLNTPEEMKQGPPTAGAKDLAIEDRGHVRLLTLNRPHRANALSPELMSALVEAFVDAGADPEVRAIVVTGAGDRAFCGGADLKARREEDKAGKRFVYLMSAKERFVFEVIYETYKPVIAAINGAAVAGGFELALACDIRIAEEHAIFGLPEAKRGMGAHFATVMLPRSIPRAHALDLLFRSENIDARHAERIGFLNKVVPKGRALEEALAWASQIADNAPVTVRRMKETASKASGLPVSAALRLNEGVNPYFAEDRVEGIAAFIEKRAPRWKGR